MSRGRARQGPLTFDLDPLWPESPTDTLWTPDPYLDTLDPPDSLLTSPRPPWNPPDSLWSHSGPSLEPPGTPLDNLQTLSGSTPLTPSGPSIPFHSINP